MVHVMKLQSALGRQNVSAGYGRDVRTGSVGLHGLLLGESWALQAKKHQE